MSIYSFQQLIGQERAKTILRHSLERGRISHAYLFVGPSGTGKRTLALAFAAALNCLADQRPCGSCRNCRRIDEGNHPDVTVLEPEGRSFKIDQIRQVQQLISLKPYEARSKIFILDGAEALTEQAANSLLKTLEEPPPYSVLILLADDSALLPTITSRCTLVHFQPLPQETVEEYLRQRGIVEAAEIAAASGGSIGKALHLAEIWPEVSEAVQTFLELVRSDQAWKINAGIYSRFKENQEFRRYFLELCEQKNKTTSVSALTAIHAAREMLKANVGPDAVLRSLAIRLAGDQRSAN